MRKVIKLLIIFSAFTLLALSLLGFLTTGTITNEGDDTLIIVQCTGNMRALEVGISVYASIYRMPLILSDKVLPEQLDKWLPTYVEDNHIDRIIVVGEVSPKLLLDLSKLGVQLKQVTGTSIPDILTKLASNNDDLSKDSLVITVSDPLAAVLGAYTRTPVFVTAANASYYSSESLDTHYADYIRNNNIKNVTIVGDVPESIKTELKNLNVSVNVIGGDNSLETSKLINDRLKNEGYINNMSVAYYGFYGELATVVPEVVRNNAVLLEDSSNSKNVLPYIDDSTSNVIITRNTESDYIMMEEPDYVSSEVINDLEENNISISYLTRPRTLDEATGLYDMKIITAQSDKSSQTLEDNSQSTVKTEVPLLAILNTTEIVDSNNITATITHTDSATSIVKWDTIHPYTYKKVDDNNYIITTGTGYDYTWIRDNNTWTVTYTFNNNTYYNTTWIECDDNSWIEMQEYRNYTWRYDGSMWKCYDNGSLIYYILSKA